ncbi:MAG: glycosyltransferase involved in cell wall biosynthesis [Candidatus Paceibacteria bacterium]|jgi:glycosyltransferase involved in cell wall biosynthesis
MPTNNKIKIVFGVNDFIVGGMQRQFVEQSKLYNSDEFEITLITLFSFPERDDFYGNLPDNIKVYKFDFKGYKDISSWLKLLKLLRSIKPDIVVSSLFFSNTIFRFLKPLVGYKVVSREHNTYTDKTKKHIFIDKVMSHVSNKIVGVSTTVADFTSKQENIPRDKFEVIHNGIDADLVNQRLEQLPEKNSLKNKLGLSVNDKVLINVARLTQQKNHELLIDGFLEFSKKYNDYKLLIVGGGGLEEEIREKVSGREDSIFVLGNQSDVFKFYKVADAFVSTSKIEGLSNAYLEALASGLPLVSTKTAGTDELINDGYNGLFVNQETIESVSETLERLHFSDLETMKRAAFETALNFDIKNTVEKYEDLFKRL